MLRDLYNRFVATPIRLVVNRCFVPVLVCAGMALTCGVVRADDDPIWTEVGTTLDAAKTGLSNNVTKVLVIVGIFMAIILGKRLFRKA